MSMSPAEILGRVRDQAVKWLWRRRQVRDPDADPLIVPSAMPPFATPLPTLNPVNNSTRAIARAIQAADALLEGHWPVFNRVRQDLVPCSDWFLDPRTGRHAPNNRFAFDINHRNEDEVGNIKYVWELSRHHHLTLLAAAFFVSRREQYARCVARHLRSWWNANPFLSGVHWTSGIELGVRLISWVWIRRLLNEWDGARGLFEENTMFLRQLHHHQDFLATFPSRGSSANNHLLAEAAGQFVAACAFPYFRQSRNWRIHAAETLRREIEKQTSRDGLNRELATDYHCFVLELCIVAALEGEASGESLGHDVWQKIQAMTDALAAVVDACGRPPRQGDGDDGIGLLLDHPDNQRALSLLATGKVLFGSTDWWPRFRHEDLRTPLWTALAMPPQPRGSRPLRRPTVFPESGMVLLCDRAGTADEIWCRCDHGPHGYLSIAAHAHADALSIEVRYGGTDILADPGTYCYHGEEEWRSYFRSTIGHNTLELAGCDQSISGGPFLWERHAQSKLISVSGIDDAPIAQWTAMHTGYQRLKPPAIHQRTVELDRRKRKILVEDLVKTDGEHPCRLAFHLGPALRCQLKGNIARLTWQAKGHIHEAILTLPESLIWMSASGENHPPLGWYSAAFDKKIPASTLIGVGKVLGNQRFVTNIQF